MPAIAPSPDTHGKMSDMRDGPVLLYDGTCGFCARSVAFVLKHERRNTLRFGRLDGALGQEVLIRRPGLVGVDSIIWYDAGLALTRSDATVAVLRYLGGVWSLLGALLALVPARIRNAGYDFVARHRHTLAGKVCVVPTPEQRARFLDPV